MSPTVAISSMPNSSSSSASNRDIGAASEDIYFGNDDSNDHKSNGRYNHNRPQHEEHQEGSLLGQALQAPSLQEGPACAPPSASADSSFDTPPSTTSRKQHSASGDSNGNLTPLQHNKAAISIGSRGPHPPNNNSNGNSNLNGNFHPHPDNMQIHTSNRSDSNSTSTCSFPNVARSGSESSTQQQQDPSFYMSNRSMQSDDSVVLSMIQHSVDTVPTSNVATVHQYQMQHAKNNSSSAALRRAQQYQQSNNNNSRLCTSPPPELRFHHPNVVAKAQQRNNGNQNNMHVMEDSAHNTTVTQQEEGGNNTPNNNNRRSVFGGRVQQRYPNPTYYTGGAPQDPAPFYNVIEDEKNITYRRASVQPPDWETLPAQAPSAPPQPADSKENQEEAPLPRVIHTATPGGVVDRNNSIDSLSYSEHHDDTADTTTLLPTDSSLTPPESPKQQQQQQQQQLQTGPQQEQQQYEPLPSSADDLISPLQSPPLGGSYNMGPTPPSSLSPPPSPSFQRSTSNNSQKQRHKRGKRRKLVASNGNSMNAKSGGALQIHETIHAQSLLLGLCFMAIWSPNNIMAPNLTQIAQYYGMTKSERDLYLGSFLALATGVLSFPLSALIGIMTDMYSRKWLFVGTAMGGAVAAAATGLSPTYPCLLLARFFSGGFMSASVSVAFSLLGDLFATGERNAASSGLTAMMGLGIVLGQVYAGSIGTSLGWEHAFFVSSGVTVFLGLCVALLVHEPVRGGKEKVLQDMLQQGKRYDRKLSWDGFWHAMTQNRSNFILMAQGFFSSIPWGIIFVFLNDYLSQERGFSVPDATYIVLLFGIGCAIGGILGGYLGALIQSINRTLLPIFMSVTTVLGIVPFVGLLNGHTTNAHGYWAMMLSVMAGVIASLPAVNVRPCLINVNPPETRGASLTAANLIVNLARGIGPCCITLLGSTFGFSRQASFNITLVVFWVISGIQLCCLAQSLPHDQDKMEAELARYAASALAVTTPGGASAGFGGAGGGMERGAGVLEEFADKATSDRPESSKSLDDETLVSIEDRMTTFDGTAARESLSFFQKGMSEINFPRGKFCAIPSARQNPSEEDESDYYYDESEEGATPRNSSSNLIDYEQECDDNLSPLDLIRRREQWVRQQRHLYGTQADTEDQEDNDEWNEGKREDDRTNPSETTRLI